MPRHRTTTLVLASAVLCSVAAACAPARPTTSSDPSRIVLIDANGNVMRQSTLDENARATFTATRDRVWSALVLSYADLGITPTLADRGTGRYGSMGFLAPRRMNGRPLAAYFSCGNGIAGPMIDNGRLTADVVTTLSSNPDGTTMAVTRVSATLRRNEGSSTDPLRCGSTGAVEEHLRTAVEARLNAAP